MGASSKLSEQLEGWQGPLPVGMYNAVLPAMLKLFSTLEQDKDLACVFASATTEERADAVTSYLCNNPASLTLAAPSAIEAAPRKLRVLLTGCFDLMHAGHYNALRQAKMAFPGDEVTLVAGVHGDEAIERAKGAPTVCNNEERCEMAGACRWVDEVVGDLPYEVPLSLLDRLGCDFAVHGDDLPRVSDGTGLFDELIKAKRLKIVKRTEGTSTTVLIGRLLSMSKDHLQKTSVSPTDKPYLVGNKSVDNLGAATPSTATGKESNSGSDTPESGSTPITPRSTSNSVSAHSPDVSAPLWMILPTMSRMAVFYADRPQRIADAKRVVYAPGEWDMFHRGHVRFLEKARALGDFLLVGCYSDESIHRKKGRNYPIQTLHERALNVLACKHADDVLLSAPWQVTRDLLTSLNVTIVIAGDINDHAAQIADGCQDNLGMGDPFVQPREMGIFQTLKSDCDLTMDAIADRILEQAVVYRERQRKKEKAEGEYNDSKVFVAES